jgi:hypothetical protein
MKDLEFVLLPAENSFGCFEIIPGMSPNSGALVPGSHELLVMIREKHFIEDLHPRGMTLFATRL